VRSCFWRPLSRPMSTTRFPAKTSVNRQVRLRRRLVKDAGFAEPGSLPSAASPRPPRVRAARLRETCYREASGELPSDFCNRMRSASTTSNRPNPGARGNGWAPPLAGRVSCETVPCGTLQPRVFESGAQRGFRLAGRHPRARSKPGTVRTGRPQSASTRAPFVANPWGASWRGLQPGTPVSDALLRTCRSSGARPALAGTTRSPDELAFAKLAARPPACAGRQAVRAASRPPPRRGARSAAPKVPSIVGMPARLGDAVPVLPEAGRRMALWR